MTLIKTNPMELSFENLFSNFFGDNTRPFATTAELLKPALNIEESENAFWVQVVAPGYTKEEFSITLEKDLLSIVAKKTPIDSKSETRIIRAEYQPKGFTQTLHVDTKKISETIEASYQNGILNIILPKVKQPEPEKKQITVN